MSNVFSQGLDKVNDLLGHSAHPAIVDVPLGAWAASNLCDGLAIATGDRKFDDAARLSMAVGLVGAAGAMITGINDYSKIPKDRPSHDVATSHAIGNAIVGSLFATSYVLREIDHSKGRRASLFSRALGLAGGSLMLYTAWLGGKLVYEMGEAVEPAMEAIAQEESESPPQAQTQAQPEVQDQEDHAHGRERLSAEAPLGKSDD